MPVPNCPTHDIGSTGRIIFGGAERGSDDSERTERDGVDPEMVAEMMTIVYDAVTPMRVRLGLEWVGGERAKRDAIEGTWRVAGGEVWRVSRLLEDE